ncbi:hypothetical protein MSCb_3070 [Mycoplasma mycoides subsp. mycoides B345/93]|uniref:Uncharacterized protein n=1 Tax=Mycoplasma mycoides subsp. mycoides SC (strain CCUG 32753 / NCTC 10114 / PG1) TaxID=272632 RepID=Q6MTG2_MYCMS|nr:hypothetical protein [Mycoplasma mycoides]PTD33976.1 hypothetical protein MSCe_5200 [Mycoplasma mycoides subsp. mycoides str. Gemu Goffa]CAE77074.1 Hypothetical protein MSC_0446 [Mycoplasma mycoides subsp. mycoides SC str. PG1]PTD32447.1 hypothetical protein MSCc_3650 [Mycoplasma mycoides subsp. mycoides C425/93]PTD32501.1 hypothetical protein MSCb_3070 [Mycoplasma mycoides subsp. mycoides B345/93]PTD33802.1 hypothetical protein MSCa_5350 [Mycoplasma mycoides subsp. mycoides PO-67]
MLLFLVKKTTINQISDNNNNSSTNKQDKNKQDHSNNEKMGENTKNDSDKINTEKTLDNDRMNNQSDQPREESTPRNNDSKENVWSRGIKKRILESLNSTNLDYLKTLSNSLIQEKEKTLISNNIDKKTLEYKTKLTKFSSELKFDEIKKELISSLEESIKKNKNNQHQHKLLLHQFKDRQLEKQHISEITKLIIDIYRSNLLNELYKELDEKIQKENREFEEIFKRKNKNEIKNKLFDLVDKIVDLQEALKNMSV